MCLFLAGFEKGLEHQSLLITNFIYKAGAFHSIIQVTPLHIPFYMNISLQFFSFLNISKFLDPFDHGC